MAKVKQLEDIGEHEIAVGYFVYVVLYVGADAHGGNKKYLEGCTQLRMNGHHADTQSDFDKYLKAERMNKTWEWAYFQVDGKINLYKQFERLLIDICKILPKPKLLNSLRGESIAEELNNHPHLEYSFEMAAYLILCAKNSDHILSDAKICKSYRGEY